MSPRVYIGGTFDLFHAGHVRLLSRASEIGPVTVSLNRDEFARDYKRRLPVMSLPERFEVVASCMFVDHVMVNDGDADSRPAILASDAKVIVHGDDWEHDGLLHQLGVTSDWLYDHGIALRLLPSTPSVSTTEILNRIRDRNLAAA